MSGTPGAVDAAAVTCPLCGAGGRAMPEATRMAALWRCADCAMLFAWPCTAPPSLYDDAYAGRGDYGYYFAVGEQAAGGDLRVPWPQRTFLRRVPPCGRLLDVGCSTGRFLAAAAGRGWQVSGVERSAAAVRAAQQVAPGRVRCGSIDDVEANGGFDAVTAWEVLEHVEDPAGFARRVAELLRPGGTLGLSVPNWRSPWTRRSREREHWPPFHLTYWTTRTLARLLGQSGFEPITLAEKPVAWGEELGRAKWALLPLSLVRALFLAQRGMHILAIGRRK